MEPQRFFSFHHNPKSIYTLIGFQFSTIYCAQIRVSVQLLFRAYFWLIFKICRQYKTKITNTALKR